MKGSKEDDKMTGPLFPRLHVNDADKGGPRAPPRNKMALYEQFSIPSQRFSSASSMLPLPTSNASNLVHTNSSSQGCGHQRNMVSPVHLPSYAPPSASDRVDPQSSDGVQKQLERSNACYRNSTGTRSAAECSIAREDSNAKDSRRKLNDADDFAVPTFDQSGNVLLSKKSASFTAPKQLASSTHNNPPKGPSTTLSSANELPNSTNKTLEQMKTSIIKPRNLDRNRSVKQLKEYSISEKSGELPAHHRVTERSCMEKPSGTSNIHSIEKQILVNPILCQESGRNRDLSRARVLNNIIGIETGNTKTVQNEFSCKEASAKGHKTSRLSGSCDREDGANENLSLDTERKDEISDASIVDCISGLEIYPDDVVRVIGPRHFWKARRAIANQQRVFAIQVFELHRLIKVQKLIASSPHLLLEGNVFLKEKVPDKMPLPERTTNSQLQVMREKDVSQKPNQNRESATEIIIGHSSLRTCEDGVNGLRSQAPSVGPCSANAPPMTNVPDNNANPWYFRPPLNQWLVPMMSPSEGLVYKPYTGPCPPTSSFMAPIYGSCPLGVSPVAGDFMNPAYGVSASHRPPTMGLMSGPHVMAPNYFPTHYGLPAMNPMISSSIVEQVGNLVASRPTGQMGQHSRSSCNMSNPRSEALFGRRWKLPASKDSEFQGSTASSPSEKARPGGADALSLFPTTQSANNFTGPSMSTLWDSQTRAIKVVPHNARSASESAARIFRSIQEERYQQEYGI